VKAIIKLIATTYNIMEQFFQKALFLKKKFTFKNNGINIDFTDKDGDFSMFINFDRITSRENMRVNTRRKRLILKYGLLAAFLTLARGFLTAQTDTRTTVIITLVALFIAGTVYAYYYFTQIKYYAVGLEDNKTFMVLYDKPTKMEAEEFINEIFERRRLYYREQYFHIEYDNNKKSEIDRMKWLRSEEIISEKEFNVVLEEIEENL
jgi:hypothetical protein